MHAILAHVQSQMERAEAAPVRAAAAMAAVALDDGDGGSAESDVAALQVWRARSRELRSLWDKNAWWTWKGVTFGEAGGAHAGRVVEIDLVRTGVTGDVPAELGALTALKTLHLHGNRLRSVPEELGALTALTTLRLGGNQLQSVPTALGGLTALTGLDLSRNELTSVPVELDKLTALSMLDLRGNYLTEVPAEFGRLTTLNTLVLSSNQLRSLPAEWERGGALAKSGCAIIR